MNRTLLSTLAAAAGTAGVLVVAPHVSPMTASAATIDDTSTSGSTSSGSTSGSSTGSGSSSGSSSSGSSSSGSSSSGSGSSSGSSATSTVTGAVAQQRFGPIQVEITVSGGSITDIQLVQQPSDGKSRWINSQAAPILVSQALSAQSASIDGVSGATLTSEAFMTSLASAIQKAGL